MICGDEFQAYALGYSDNPKIARNAIATVMDPFLNLFILIRSVWMMTLQHKPGALSSEKRLPHETANLKLEAPDPWLLVTTETARVVRIESLRLLRN